MSALEARAVVDDESNSSLATGLHQATGSEAKGQLQGTSVFGSVFMYVGGKHDERDTLSGWNHAYQDLATSASLQASLSFVFFFFFLFLLLMIK